MRAIGSRGAVWMRFLVLVHLSGCSSARQTLGHEVSSDTNLPWAGGPAYYGRWPHGPPTEASFFPILVWMQSPPNATRFQDVGINFFTGLWEGPTEDQMKGLASANMPAVCDQSGVWRAHVNDLAIRGWLQPDQPDDAQLQSDGTYAGCVEPSAVQASYQAMLANDPTRPVFMNLGRGVADPNWVGRGSCSGRSDMYPDYVRGADILTFITYPVNAGLPLETVALGVDNLRRWSNDQKPVIAAIEASNINDVVRPTPEQIRSEVWMALVHGAGGIQYFCHRLEPAVSETDCLDDGPTAAVLPQINSQITSLASVLNTQSVGNGVTVASSTPSIPVDTMLKRFGGATYLFAVAMRSGTTTATFTLRGLPATASAEILGEARTLPVTNGILSDGFQSYGVHLYRITYQ